MKKFRLAFLALATIALLVTGCGGGGGGSDNDDVTPVVESGSTGTGSGSESTDSSVSTPAVTVAEAIEDSLIFIEGRSVEIWARWCCDHEVTQAEYESVMEINPSYFQSSPADGETQANRPVENVSWYDAIMYCNKRSADDGLTPCYKVNGKTDTNQWGYTPHAGNSISGTISCDFNANGYRLPTEAEWEYLARGGNLTNNGQTTYSGNGDIGNLAWHEENSGSKTHEVKKKTKNILDLYDMGGNVWEWCWDWYSSISASTPFDGAASGSVRVLRGGSFTEYDWNCTVSYRLGYDPINRTSTFGFRVVSSGFE